MNLILLILVYITLPVILIWLTIKYSFFKKLGSVVLAYALGIIIANIGILPKASDAFLRETVGKDRAYVPKQEAAGLYTTGTFTQKDVTANNIASIQDSVQSALIPLALSLILFSLSVRRWLKFSGKGFLSMILALISVSIIVATGYLLFGEKVAEGNKVAGMLIGTYTGGSINMAALAIALKVQPHTFIMTNTYDMIIGGITILFFITAGPRFFRFFLPPFKADISRDSENLDIKQMEKQMAEDFDDYSGIFRKGIILPLIGALGLSILIFGIGIGVYLLLPKVSPTISIILTVTTLGVAASFIPKIRNIKKSYQLGMYFITAFSLVIASRCDLSVFFQIRYIYILLFVTWAYFGSLILHCFLSWIFKVDADDFLVTTTGFVYSPPFVPMVAAALKNRDVILTGLATGIIGWIVGNYLGVIFSVWLGKI
jgi:uncharacterized membrane protein